MMRRRLGGVELIMVAARRKERVDECAASGRSLKGGDGTVSARLMMATSERLSRALGGLVGGTLSSRYWSVARRRAKREALRSSREDESDEGGGDRQLVRGALHGWLQSKRKNVSCNAVAQALLTEREMTDSESRETQVCQSSGVLESDPSTPIYWQRTGRINAPWAKQ
jgi:ribosomal protein L34E